MIRFVDLSDAYWGGDGTNARERPCCAFLDTITDRFVENSTGHVFSAPDDFNDLPSMRVRLYGLVPPGFFK